MLHKLKKKAGHLPKRTLSALISAILVALMIAPNVMATTSGPIIVSAESPHREMTDWGYDIKQGGKAVGLTTELAQEVFIDDQMSVLRIPIYAENAHPSAGVVDGSYYTDVVGAVQRVKAVKSSVTIFASLKLDSTHTFPAWVKQSDGTVDPVKYAQLLYDFLNYMKSQQITIDVLGDDNESTWNEGDITPQKHDTIVNNLKSLCSAGGITFPKIIAPEDYGPASYTWLDTLFANGWDDSMDYAGVHYYSKNRNASYVTKLQNFASSAGSKRLWDSEFHWDSLGVSNYNDALNGLIAAFDQFDQGFQGMSWWAFNPESTGNPKAPMEAALVKTTANAYPVDVDDNDGVDMDAGKLNTRAFKQGSDLVVWIMNDTATTLTNKYVQIPGKTISAPPSYTQWDSASTETTGTASIVRGDTIKITLPSQSITYVRFPNIYYAEVDDNAASYTGSGWTTSSIHDNYEEGNHNTTHVGDYATYTFTGTGIEWVGSVADNHGKAEVYIDGQLMQTVNSYSPTYKTQQVLFSISNLANTTHTIKIVELDTKDASSSNYINNVDAFYVITDVNNVTDDTSATYTGSGWDTGMITANYGGSSHASSTSGDYATYTFTGTGIEWVGSVADNHGKADVYIDGAFKETVDGYSPQYLMQQNLFSVSGLAYGAHTIKITVRSDKNAASSGYKTNIDAFYVD